MALYSAIYNDEQLGFIKASRAPDCLFERHCCHLLAPVAMD